VSRRCGGVREIAEDVTQETSLRAAEPGHATEYRAELSRRCHHQGGAHWRTDVGRAGEVGLRGHRVQAHAAEFARRRLRRFAGFVLGCCSYRWKAKS